MTDDVGDIKHQGKPQADEYSQRRKGKLVQHGDILKRSVRNRVRSANFPFFKFTFNDAVIKPTF